MDILLFSVTFAIVLFVSSSLTVFRCYLTTICSNFFDSRLCIIYIYIRGFVPTMRLV